MSTKRNVTEDFKKSGEY